MNSAFIDKYGIDLLRSNLKVVLEMQQRPTQFEEQGFRHHMSVFIDQG